MVCRSGNECPSSGQAVYGRRATAQGGPSRQRSGAQFAPEDHVSIRGAGHLWSAYSALGRRTQPTKATLTFGAGTARR